MATYAAIQEWIRVRHGFVVQTAWIADVRERHGLTTRAAPNRMSLGRAAPCPPSKVASIEEALRHFGMIR